MQITIHSCLIGLCVRACMCVCVRACAWCTSRRFFCSGISKAIKNHPVGVRCKDLS